MADDNEHQAGIKSFTTTFGLGSDNGLQEVPPTPAYRMLLVGDFGIEENGDCHDLARRDLAELLSDLSPQFTIEAENLLGSYPPVLSETLCLSKLSHLRPEKLSAQFSYKSEIGPALKAGDFQSLERFGQRYDKLAESALQPENTSRPIEHQKTAVAEESTKQDMSPDISDDLDRLLSMVEAPEAAPTAAKGLLDSFIEQNIPSDTSRGAPEEAPIPGAERLLTLQAKAFLSVPRCQQILENWIGLRLLLSSTPKDQMPDVSLLQIPLDADVGDISQRLEEALSAELFDLVVFTNRCDLKNAGVAELKALAIAAHTFDTLSLATLTPDFSGVAASELAMRDAPQQIVGSIGHEGFFSLRDNDAAHHLGLLWNDGCARPMSQDSPAYFIPSSWIAATMISQQVARTGWPMLTPGLRAEFDALEVQSKHIGGREVGDAVRATISRDSSEALAQAGITVLSGQENWASVFFNQPATIANGKGNQSLTNALVLARLNTLLQSVLMETFSADQPVDEMLQTLRLRFAQLNDIYSGKMVFDVKLGDDDDGGSVIEIAARPTPDIAPQQEFEFKIPV
ncbi:hypothetical protein DYI23_20445 [Roseibium polysiphoniae]|uniref:TssC1 N-terminal domain-containing protein n=1 Tax=Roseibium polysiphoniae TaxID=2571221 RepID=A0A944CHD7_9HYPH|nr:hypothetical protein [Roseibium polysiphoniae]MBS8262607.1 hypothetical protein [Roseibium polysiphoniae]